MPSAFFGRGVVESIDTSTSAYTSSGGISFQRLPTDKVFLTNLKLVSLLTDFAYIVEDKDSVNVGSGDFTSNPIYINSVSAFTVTDAISVSYLKYGYKFNKAVFVLTPVETLLFMSQDVNTNSTLSLSGALALGGITVDKPNKTVTISVSRTMSEVYDFLQAYQADITNVDTLVDGEIFSTALGNAFNIQEGWGFLFSAPPIGGWNITGIVGFIAEFAVSNFDTASEVVFGLAGTWQINDSLINRVSSDVAGVIIDPSGTTSIPNNSDPANITIIVLVGGITVTGLEIGMVVRVIESNNFFQDAYDNFLLAETTNSSTSFAWSNTGGYVGSVDVTISKVGTKPIRIPNILVTEAIQSIPVTIQDDRSYEPSSGLVYDSTMLILWDLVTFTDNKFEVNVPSTVQNLYSYLVEIWTTNTAVTNYPFPMESTGDGAYTLILGWEFSTTTIPFLYNDGFRYLDNNGVETAYFVGLKQFGDVEGLQGEIQQQLGGAIIDGWNAPNQVSTGNIEQVLQVYEEAVYDYRDYLHIKFRENGYYQDSLNVTADTGTLKDELYSFAVGPKLIPNFTLGVPSLVNPPALSFTSSTWQGKIYAITITDSLEGNSGEDILRLLNWLTRNEDDTYFDWFDFVIRDGSGFQTQRGDILNTGTDMGVKVVLNDGVTAHPDFTRHQADDGTYYVPIPVYIFSVVALAGVLIEIYDNEIEDLGDNNTLLFTATSAGIPLNFTHLGSTNSIRVLSMRVGYVEQTVDFILSDRNQSLDIQLKVETN